ncbi:DUF1905 domain-containing protein [Nocardioides sp. GY 10127]|uniref:DUF1905 domain-containing protein n=1 Tax=Nocardioides sp. GY 10127 TaxID=2569762 RepID=UPI0010A76C61|nr:DUF1905 domain-containing protein [Nocardioides sp. GY 10127]TIC79357.1 DUF1905 domain-containing protein [Nocardioides sp. GY 10127]
MELTIQGPVIEWRGPAPHHFVPLDEDDADLLREVAAGLTYGWGCIPVTGRVGDTSFTTSLMPREGTWLVPLKVAVRRAEGIALGDVVEVHLDLGSPA